MATLKSLEETQRLVESGAPLLMAADESLLAQLPKGNWIGGTIPYFMVEAGGTVDRSRIFVTEFPDFVGPVAIRDYAEEYLPHLPGDYPDNGATFLILPAGTGVHLAFAKDCATYPGLFDSPLLGWVAGVHLADLGKVQPKVFNGATGHAFGDRAVALHLSLPADRFARVDTLNLFTQGQGDRITFPTTGFEVRDCFVNGARRNFAEYLEEIQADSRLPLVADYSGAAINVSFQSVDSTGGVVALFAPVFQDTEYRLANPVDDYVKAFTEEMATRTGIPVFACNCILNYVYAGLEGKRTQGVAGPVTFGEIAYMLLNQTMVYLTFEQQA